LSWGNKRLSLHLAAAFGTPNSSSTSSSNARFLPATQRR
jgi:hypothetical protein